jgi:hypothetical protein
MKNKLKITIISLELACLISLIALSGYSISSLGPTGFAKQMGLAIGMTAGVKENGYNTLARELKEKDAEITARETALAEKEAAILRSQGESNARMSFLILGIGLLLLSLILLNFYLDTKRRREADYTVKIRK